MAIPSSAKHIYTNPRDQAGLRRSLWSAAIADYDLQQQIDTINTTLTTVVVGPGSSTDNALARFDGTTGKLLQNSSYIVSDEGVLDVTISASMAAASVITRRVTDDQGSVCFEERQTRRSDFNLCLGINAGAALQPGGAFNVLVGGNAGLGLTTGDNNMCVGLGAGQSLTTASNCVFVGVIAGRDTTGSQNVGVGRRAGLGAITGTGNTFVGDRAGEVGQVSTVSNSMGLGQGAVTTADNQVVIGNTSVTQCVINGGAIINEQGIDADTRIEGDTATQLFVCDAGLDRVRIGTTTAGTIADFSSARVDINNDGTSTGPVDLIVRGQTSSALFFCDASLNAVRIGISNAITGEIAEFFPSVINFNKINNDIDFNVEGTTATNLFQCDASANAVYIGTTSFGTIVRFSENGTIFNETGLDQDIRIEGLTATNLFKTDGGTDSVLIGTTTAGVLADIGPSRTIFNSSGSDRDFRILGNSLSHLFFCDASAATENIALAATAAPNWQSMDRGLFLGVATTAPTGNPSSGFFLFVDPADNTLKARGPSGTVTPLASP